MSDAVCLVVMGRHKAGGVMTVLPCKETRVDSGNDLPTTVQPSNVKLMQTLVVLSLAYANGMTLNKIQADVIVRKQKKVQQTIDTFSAPAFVKYE